MYHISVQRAVSDPSVPNTPVLKRWAKEVLKEKTPAAEVTLRIVDKEEMTTLNYTYRQKNKPTNVLSFPFDLPPGVPMDMPMLGDIIICADVISEEAQAQQKTLDAHWAHMIVHGILHLLGYDHENDQDADIMETEEARILQKLGFSNPYHIA